MNDPNKLLMGVCTLTAAKSSGAIVNLPINKLTDPVTGIKLFIRF